MGSSGSRTARVAYIGQHINSGGNSGKTHNRDYHGNNTRVIGASGGVRGVPGHTQEG